MPVCATPSVPPIAAEITSEIPASETLADAAIGSVGTLIGWLMTGVSAMALAPTTAAVPGRSWRHLSPAG
jgi:hypothetical protein